jgi:hypothetical protein
MTLILNGQGNSGPISFQMPDVRVGADQRPWTVPPDRGSWHYFRAGLLQWGVTGPALFDSTPCGRPFQSVPQALIAAGCLVTSTPTSLWQQLLVTDAAGNPVEKWQVISVALTPLGPQQPMWTGSAFTAAAFSSPFTLTPSNFQTGDVFTFSIPGLIRGDF